MTVIKSLIIPKFVYILSLLSAPKEIVQELNRILFKFLWKGTDEVTRLSTINEYENGGLKMIDLESMITTVFVDTRLWKTKHLQKRFQNFGQSYVLSTHPIKIHQLQPTSMT